MGQTPAKRTVWNRAHWACTVERSCPAEPSVDQPPSVNPHAHKWKSKDLISAPKIVRLPQGPCCSRTDLLTNLCPVPAGQDFQIWEEGAGFNDSLVIPFL